MLRFLFFYLFLPASLACTQVVKVGADFGWPPYSYIEEGEIIGLDIEITRFIFYKLDYCVNFISMPSTTRAIEQIKNAKVDLVLAASYSPERAALGKFSEPYRYETVVLFTHTNADVEAASMSALFAQGATFALNRGSYIGQKFELLTQSHLDQVVFLSSVEKRLLLLNNGRVDFTVEDLYAGNYLAQHNNYGNIRQTQHVVYQNPVHLLVSEVGFNHEKLSEINRAIVSGKARIKKLHSNYLTSGEINKSP